MARIFVSYSRKDMEFCKRLTDGLQKRDLDTWVDWEGIPPTVDWMNEIQKAVEEADAFLFVISPDSITSEVCKKELKLAVTNGKRLIPIVTREINWDDAPSEISKLNYIFFRESDDFKAAFEALHTAIATDYKWAKTHSRLQVRALEWERGNRDNGFLLRGRDLEEAEQQMSVNAKKDPLPTDLQREYLLKSRQATDRQRRIVTGSLVAATLVMFVITAVVVTPRILDRIAQSRAHGDMVPIEDGPSVFGTEDLVLVKDFGFPPRQSVETLPGFQIGKYEVSNYQYGQCVTYGNCTVPVDQTDFKDKQKLNYPVVNVTLFQANTYCRWLGQRLPDQFEWERAARGPELLEWPWGNNREPTPETTNMPWGEYKPSGLQPVDSNPDGVSPEGIYNLMGNVAEWTVSFIEDDMTIMTYDPTKSWDGDPDTFIGTIAYAQRGGGWRYNVDEVALYNADLGTSARDDLGFRCAADAK